MKKQIIFLITFLTFAATASAQGTFFTKSGTVEFFSTTPMEDIEATNRQAVGFLKTDQGSISFGVLVKSFKFKNALMEEHFNENYAESDTYPKAKFKGKITNLSEIDFNKNGTYEAQVTGNLSFHGVTQEVTVTSTLTISDDGILAVSTFKLKPEDFNIDIPSIVRSKIAKEITVKLDIDYKLYKK